MFKAVDQNNGAGIRVDYSGADPLTTVTAQIRDASQADYRDAGSVTGDAGTIFVGIEDGSGDGSGQVTFSRTYSVRGRYDLSGVITYTAETLITPTRGFVSDIFELIVRAKHILIRHNIRRINGNVFHCIDPRAANKVVPDLPALFLYQSDIEALNQSQDSGESGFDVPITIAIVDRDDTDAISGLEWMLYIRQAIYDLFNRKQIDTELENEDEQGTGGTIAGRRWRVTPGVLLPAPGQGYKEFTTFMTLHADIERPIAEG